ncbi:N5-carboxyaminoimidazole ribonucleotide synthase [Symmachiella macrocystis]|uniref:N5-carboxyaminoimidazole ribonucleotide synthase n=1 Tax=Symmachiella macrocystis TaxID=2527985 RepID=A0A5C6BPD3_9PLAN|nr:5-(carboxyamino)imidazole ribonucleotide synthase [Symmachiella macrocystis]TWU13885.1 N5-carboxyaminoimidazole ribonucleotide synthase [Symmachiella macrocystis]
MILPGKTIGVLGGGQLGRMFTLAAQRMGYRVHVFSPGSETPAGQVANLEITASFDDEDALRTFASRVDVVTFEFENIPLSLIESIARTVPVRPSPEVVALTQNRIAEKTMLHAEGFPVAQYSPVREGTEAVGFFDQNPMVRRAVLKSAEFGYDGKGQAVVNDREAAVSAFADLGSAPAVIEEHIELDYELSVIGARSIDGEIACFGPVLNRHCDHVLDVSIAPVEHIDPVIKSETINVTRELLESLDVCGVICVEFFVDNRGRLLVNEIAPRPHNSGHMTIEAAITSQFEQQVRAICGLPLGSMEQTRPAAMANMLGQHFGKDSLKWCEVFLHQNLYLHLYGKRNYRHGRKMGHLTATAMKAVDAEGVVLSARSAIVNADSQNQQIANVS